MRVHGTLKKWNDDRGFGFIEAPNNEKEIFVHISAFPRDGIRPRVGELVSFEMRVDPDGKMRAVAVQRAGATANTRKPRRAVAQKPKSVAIVPALIFLGLLCFVGYKIFLPLQSGDFASPLSATPRITPVQNPKFRCDGRQHCSEMTSREEAVFFIRNCPNTKMDGDNDGIPCENDSRF